MPMRADGRFVCASLWILLFSMGLRLFLMCHATPPAAVPHPGTAA